VNLAVVKAWLVEGEWMGELNEERGKEDVILSRGSYLEHLILSILSRASYLENLIWAMIEIRCLR
jgi:hypothetical protein